MTQSRGRAYARHSLIRRTITRLGAFGATVLIAASALGVGAPPVQAANATKPSISPDLIARGTGGRVDPIPYQFPDDGRAGTTGDPSIGLGPVANPGKRPKVKTALKGQWSRDKRVWANPNGTFTVEYGQRLNFLSGAGEWTPIDLTLTEKNGVFKPVSAGTDLELKPADPRGTLATLRGDDGSVSLRVPGGPVAGKKVADRLEFDRGNGHHAVFVRPTDTGFEFGATLADAAAASRIDFVFDPGTLVPSIAADGYSINLTNPAAKDPAALIGTISAPTVLDGAEHEADLSVVSVELNAQPDGTYQLSYRIDESWLAAPERVFPVTLDPSVCIREGDTGCGANTNAWDIWYGSGQASSFVTSSTSSYLHVGYYLGTGDPWGQGRSALYFPGATLEDGAMVTSATLALKESNNYSGGTTAQIYARLINKPTGWQVDTSSASWNSLAAAVNGSYDSDPVDPCNTGATDCTLNLDVTKIVRAWYTRRGTDWKPNAGIQVRYVTEGTSHAYDETSFYRYTEALSDRPKLTINYEVPAFKLTFNSDLGPTYAPSMMISGQASKLPIKIQNTSTTNWDTTNYRIGYRWFDTKGVQVGTVGLVTLGSTVNAGTTYTPSPAPSLTPPGPGQYTLRFDVVKIVGGVNLLASDWAQPTKYYSRNKNILTSDATRWTGTSVIERAEFGITVVNGQGTGGDPKSVSTGDGGALGINLWSKNLTYAGDSGLGFGDRIPAGLQYGYNSKVAASCPAYKGILGACGWFTNYDERITAGSSTGDFTYYDPAGNAHFVDSDRSGQLVGAPVQVSRIRATLFDENRPSAGGTLVALANEVPVVPQTSGPNAVRVAANADVVLQGFTPNGAELSLNTYRQISFALRNTDAASTAICFEIHNRTTDASGHWICLISGPWFDTGSTTEGYSWGGDTVIDHWSAHQNDIWELVVGNGAFGSPTDDYYIKTVKIKTSSTSNVGYTYIDDVAATQRKVWGIVPGVAPTWTSTVGSVSVNSTEYMSTASLQVNSSATCTGTCYSALSYFGAPLDSLQAAPIARWWWKKAGGTSVSMEFFFTDLRSGGPAAGSIIYYAGAVPAITLGSTQKLIQVSPNLPGHFTRVTRNILEDARQVLGYYNDAKNGSSSTSPPTQGPTPDSVQWTGFKASAVDGQFMLLEQFELQSGPEWAGINRYADTDVENLEYDFEAEFPDGSTHIFNRDGLLIRILDRDQNRVQLDWTYASSGSGQTAYTLATIHASGDDTVSGGNTYNRQIDVTKATAGSFTQWTFKEALGTTGAPVAGRRADFYVGNAAGGTYGANDLAKVSPARHNSSACGTAPSGCTEFEYTTTSSHLISRAVDPRRDGTIDARLEVTWSGGTTGDPMKVLDLAHASAPMLRVLSYDRTADSPFFQRPLYQDAAAVAAGFGIHEDLTPEGSMLAGYIRQACTGDCATSTFWPSGTDATLATRKAVSHYYDGLAHVSQTTTYRCPGVALGGCTGTTPLLSITRQGSNAGAKVDNYPDALAAGEIAWSQTADQYFASARDSGGSNLDLYRTEYAYNGVHEPTVVRAPAFNRVPDYPGVIKSSEGLAAYWRLGEPSGTFADSSGTGKTGTGTSVAYAQPGAIARDANTSVGFNGTSSRITSSAVLAGLSAYTLAGWVKLTASNTGDTGLFGRYVTNSGAVVYVRGSDGTLALAHNSSRVFTSEQLELGRWYHVVGTWNGTQGRLYLDGELVGVSSITGTPTAGASLFEIGTYGNAGATHFFTGSLDEVSLRSVAIDESLVRAQYAAGRGVALNRTEATYGWALPSNVHLDAHPKQQATQLVENGDFENGLAWWDVNHGLIQTTGSPGKGIALPTTSTTSQTLQLLPGQRIHFQLDGRTDGTTNSKASYALSYWRLSTGTWVDLVADFIANTTTWTTRAYEYTVPFDSTGLVRISLSDGGAVGDARFDDILLVTDWRTFTYRPHTNVALGGTAAKYLQDGLVETTSSFGASVSVRIDKAVYAATTAHPAVFPTSTIANYVDGTQGPYPEEDATTTTSYDSWGRQLVVTDPDGVDSQTIYAANMTDVATTENGLDQPTTYTYDEVGNVETTTSPLGRVTTSTYDTRNHVLTTTASDGVVNHTDFDNYGRMTAGWTNWVDGNPATGGAADDLLTVYAYDAYGRATQVDVDCGSVSTCATGGLDARTTTSYDLLGNTVATTVYPGAAGTGTARVTTNHFETTGTSPKYSRTKASGVQQPLAPTSSSVPFCPGSTTIRCNSASIWKVAGAWVGAVDMNGTAVAATDGYGIVTVSDHDLAGRPVRVIAGYDPAVSADSDTNVETKAEYDLSGDAIVNWDAAGRRDVRSYDPLGRLVRVSHRDTSGTEFAYETTSYLPSGRVDAAFDGAGWTRTQYDAAGRAIRTIANWDPAGNAGMTMDPLESGNGTWSSGSSGFFTTAAAPSLASDADAAGNTYDSVAPVSGRGRLHVTTHATSGNTGAWVDLSGPTYQSGHTYKASFDLYASASGLSLTAYLGQDASGGSFGSLGITSTTTWTRYTVSWTAGSSLTTPIRFAVSKAAAGTSHLYIDNLVVWDSTTPDRGIVSSLTVYDADGETIASALPPGDPATERPLVTTVAFDPAGRTVSSTTNGASGFYASVIAPTSGLVAYYPLDERLGTAAADKKPGGGTALTIPASLTMGAFGGIDEARTSARFSGTNGVLSRSSNATAATTNVSLEAWVRTIATPSATGVIASNGTATNGWGLAIDSAGNAAGFVINASAITTLPSTKNIADGVWHHLVLSRDATVWAISVDGVAKTLSPNTTNPGTPGAGLGLGALSDGSLPFAGQVDEVAVYTADISGLASAHWAAGRASDTTTALTTRNAYDRFGRLNNVWAPDLVRTRTVYDRLGNQVETWANYRDGTTTGGTADDDVKSTFAYDVLGELVGYCPAVQVASVGSCAPATTSEPKAWHYGFDAMGRQTTTVPPDNTAVVDLSTEEVAYELGGRIAKTCRYPAGGSCGTFSSRHVDFTYDDLGRILTQKTWDRSVSPAADTLKFTKTMTWLADGSPSTVNEGSDTLTYTYDTAGRTSQLKRGATVLTAYTYTPDTSTIATRTDGASGATAFTYDWARRQTVIDPPDTFVAGTVSRTYRLDGLLATQSFPSSITETLAYDAVKRPTSIGLGTPGSLSQTFDRAGRVTSDGRSLSGISGDAGTGTQTFTYDGLSRLTGSSLASAPRTYQYDLDGNRTRRVESGVTTDFTYDRADQLQQQVIGVTTKAFDYDRYGNLLKGADVASAFTSYAYDEANRLMSITPPSGGTVTFTLDAMNRHATRSVGGTLSDTYSYIDATETAWQTGNGTPTSSLLDAEGSRLAIKTGSTVSWLVFDLHGSVTAMCTSGTSAISDAYRFDGFGQQMASAGTTANPWRFRGLLNIGADTLTGALLGMGAREYSPQLGVFTQQDSFQGSAANPMTMNRFLYALANPATLIDPDGHRPCYEDDSGRCVAWIPSDEPKEEPTEEPEGNPPPPVRASQNEIDLMTSAQLKTYVENWPKVFGNPTFFDYDFLYAYCRLGELSRETCHEYAHLTEWNEVGGPITIVFAAGAGAFAGLAIEYGPQILTTITALKDQVKNVGQSPWLLSAFDRGRAIEQTLGQNLPSNFPTIDRYVNGIATSIKSLDLNAVSYQNTGAVLSRLKGYVDSLAGLQTTTWGGVTVNAAQVTQKVLNLAVPQGAQSQQHINELSAAAAYAQSQGITLILSVIP